MNIVSKANGGPIPSGASAAVGAPGRAAALDLRQRRSWFGPALAVVVAVLAVVAVQDFARNENVRWNVVGQYIFDPRILNGVLVTINLTVVAMVLALVLAVIIALMRLSKTWALRALASLFVWFFRSVPVLVLLVVTFNFALIYPVIEVGIPGVFTLFSSPTQTLISAYWAAVIAFALNEASYASEILRSSILAVSKGQTEAGSALGMTSARIYARVVLPQAIRIAIPPLGNDVINMLKSTSLVAFISVFDLMYTAQSIYQRNYEVFALLLVVTFWYVVLVSILSIAQSAVERRLRGPRQRTRLIRKVRHSS